MKEKNLIKAVLVVVAASLLLPIAASGQSTRGDFDYDGTTNVSDLTKLLGYLLTDEWGDIPSGIERDTLTVNGASFVMVHVEGGTYTASDGETRTVGDFWVCQTEVTNKLWMAVTGQNASTGIGLQEQMPVTKVTYPQMLAFIDSLNSLTGLQFRMPSEWEWEWAARGGQRSRGFTYAGSNNPKTVAWHRFDLMTGGAGKQDVGLLMPNELGLYDMSGNVNEFCVETYTADDNGTQVIRGGSFDFDESRCRISWRSYFTRDHGASTMGFRLFM